MILQWIDCLCFSYHSKSAFAYRNKETLRKGHIRHIRKLCCQYSHSKNQFLVQVVVQSVWWTQIDYQAKTENYSVPTFGTQIQWVTYFGRNNFICKLARFSPKKRKFHHRKNHYITKFITHSFINAAIYISCSVHIVNISGLRL